MARKRNVKKDISDAIKLIKELMQDELAIIADQYIKGVMKNYRSLGKASKIDATKKQNVNSGTRYLKALNELTGLIARDAIEGAKLEVPTINKKKFSDFDKLPPAVKKRIRAQNELLVGTQIQDLEKQVNFQFQSSLDATDSENQIENDMKDAGQEYLLGVAVNGAASVTAATTINVARSAFFYEPDVLAEIEAFQFQNPAPVSPICKDLAGKIFSKDQLNAGAYQPPLHFNCKSFITPILNGNLRGRPIEKLEPSKAELNKYVQFHECCDCDNIDLLLL